MKNIRDFISKDNTEITNTLLIPSAFMYLDYSNGINHVVRDDNDQVIENIHNVGIVSGSLNTITGKSGTGKTTWALGLAQAVIEPYFKFALMEDHLVDENDAYPVIEIIDAEMKFDLTMAQRVLRYPNKIMKRVVTVHREKYDTKITECITRHIEFKKKNMKKLKHRFKDIYNDNFHAYPPTVIIIDSINQIECSKFEDFEAMVGNTAGLLRAKSIQNVYNFMSDVCGKYNVTFFCMQHILNDTNMGFLPKAKQTRFLKKDEKFAAGEKSILLSTNIFRMDFVKEVGTEKSSMLNLGKDISGFVVRCTIAKCSTNISGRSFHLVNIANKGFDRLVSTFYEAAERGDLEKSGNGYFIPGIEGKYTTKKMLEESGNDFNVVLRFYDHMCKKLTKLLSSAEDIQKGLLDTNDDVETIDEDDDTDWGDI
jgi:archaellum biogenesis ATPase FlaH